MGEIDYRADNYLQYKHDLDRLLFGLSLGDGEKESCYLYTISDYTL
jgi:hypothetical protein